MNIELLSALITFAFVSSITPGPNNMMLMASGANFGFQQTLPHMLGVSFGFVFMVFLVGIGLMKLFDGYPLIYTVLKAFSVIYLLYLAYKIGSASSKSPDAEQHSNSSTGPLSFIQAASFQWVNPKAWTMALTAISVYAPSDKLSSIALVAAIFGLVNLPSVTVWTLLGQQLKRLLNSELRLRVFNITMASLLVASLYPVVTPLL
jgi:threonine/homoserine/homoserine lactone efflux protein